MSNGVLQKPSFALQRVGMSVLCQKRKRRNSDRGVTSVSHQREIFWRGDKICAKHARIDTVASFCLRHFSASVQSLFVLLAPCFCSRIIKSSSSLSLTCILLFGLSIKQKQTLRRYLPHRLLLLRPFILLLGAVITQAKTHERNGTELFVT